jgi:precorrin-6B methylase 1
MGLARLAAITESLTSNGCDPHTPAAIVSRATWPDEQVRIGTLGKIHTQATGLSSLQFSFSEMLSRSAETCIRPDTESQHCESKQA